MSKEFLHKGGKCGNGAALRRRKTTPLPNFPRFRRPTFDSEVAVVGRHRENAGTQFTPVPILHAIIQSVPLPPHCNLDARMPFERAPSLKSPLIYIIAKTEKKRRPCRPARRRRPSNPRPRRGKKDEKEGTCVKHAFSRLPSPSLLPSLSEQQKNDDFC